MLRTKEVLLYLAVAALLVASYLYVSSLQHKSRSTAPASQAAGK